MPSWIAQLLFALLCTAAPIAVRTLIDLEWPGAGPFALAYPAVMIATLFGRWQSGLLTLLLTLAYIVLLVIPGGRGLGMLASVDVPRIMVNAASMAACLLLSELFRRAVREAAEDRNRQIAHRDLLLAELEHRVRNNFATVKGLLQIQMNRTPDAATRDALETTLYRVDAIVQANHYLIRNADTESPLVDLPNYLADLCAALEDSLFAHRPLKLVCDCREGQASRNRAVSIGLLVNELVTNVAKHAFPDGRAGTVCVSLAPEAEMLRLTVTDDGVGMAESQRPGSLGRKLIEALVRQAQGSISSETGPNGTRVTMLIDRGA